MSKTAEPTEIELKLILPGRKAEATVVDFLSQNDYAVNAVEPADNTDIYMDTSDWALLKNKMSLRYRLSNGQAMYTLKSVGGIEDGIAKRAEEEISLDEPAHSPTEIPIKTIRKRIEDVIYPRTLMEQILIKTNRHRYSVVSPDKSEFELDFDASKFSADALFKPQRVPIFYQMEAELLDGPEASLRKMSSILAKAFGFEPATSSKLEYAMSSLKVEPLVKRIPEELRVELDDQLATALKKFLTVEFRWFMEQLPGIVSDRDPEFVHQARVATRRMRSLLLLFHAAFAEREVLYLESRLKWLGGLLGAVRDIDVFRINLRAYKGKIERYPKARRLALESVVVKQRRAPLKALNAALAGRKFTSLERRMNDFLASPSDGEGVATRRVSEIAQEMLADRFKYVSEQSRKLGSSPRLSDFHCLRIEMKRLRYTLEFFAPPFGEKYKELIARTVEVQDCLGELQDTVFNRQFIKRILRGWEGKIVDSDLVFVLGEIYEYQGEIARGCQARFGDTWARFNSEETIKSTSRSS